MNTEATQPATSVRLKQAVASNKLCVDIPDNEETGVLMNTYPCAELGAKPDYSCITATRTFLNGSDVRYM